MSKYPFAELADTLVSNKTFVRLSQASGRPLSTIRKLWQESALEAQDQGLYPIAETYDIYILKSIRGKLGLKLDNNIDGSILRFPETPEPIERPHPNGGFQGWQDSPKTLHSPIELAPAAGDAQVSGPIRGEITLLDVPLSEMAAPSSKNRFYKTPRHSTKRKASAKRAATRLTSQPKQRRKKVKLTPPGGHAPGSTVKAPAKSKRKSKGKRAPKSRPAVDTRAPGATPPLTEAQINTHAATVKELRPKISGGSINDGDARRYASAAGALIGYHSHMAALHGLRGDAAMQNLHLSARDKYLKESEAALKHTAKHSESASVQMFSNIKVATDRATAAYELADAQEIAVLETAKKHHKKRHRKDEPHVVLYTNSGKIHSNHSCYDDAERAKMEALKGAPGEPLAVMSRGALNSAASAAGSPAGAKAGSEHAAASKRHEHLYSPERKKRVLDAVIERVGSKHAEGAKAAIEHYFSASNRGEERDAGRYTDAQLIDRVHNDVRSQSRKGAKETAKTLPSDRYHWYKYNHAQGANVSHRGHTHKIIAGTVFGVRPATSPKAAAAGHHRMVLKSEGLTKVFTVPGPVHKRLLGRSKPVRVQKIHEKPAK